MASTFCFSNQEFVILVEILSILSGESNILAELGFYKYLHNVMVVDLGDREVPSC